MINSIILIAGLVLILWGANALTDGASAIAQRFNISSLVIGLTVVAFGTSAPEFVISLLSAIKGSSGLAIGNVIGSNIFNTLVIVGCTALIVPLKISKSTLTKEIPFALLASIVLYILANDVILNEALTNELSRADGLILISFFLIFMAYTFAVAHNGTEEEKIPEHLRLGKAICLTILGLGCLIGGGQLFVNGATGIARMLGVSESTIGLTLVAGGTSLPELATSIAAALKNKPGMAVGNAIGSNLFNIFLVLGCSATVSPMTIAGITQMDYAVLIGSAILLWLTGKFFQDKTINRYEGGFMVSCFIGYTVYLIMQS